ncbi:MAG: ankyrin repeat domain-containing protein, partial [Planctomycetota bacterium]
PLHFAVSKGHIEIVRALIRVGANVNTVDHEGETPLHSAMVIQKERREEMARLLLAFGARPHAVHGTDAGTPTDWAAGRGDSSLVALLLAHDPRFRERAREGWTPLHWAAYVGYSQIARDLLERGADVHQPFREVWNPLALALYQGHPEVVKVLKAFGAVLTPGHESVLLLFSALRSGDSETVKGRIAQGQDPNVLSPEGISPLAIAVMNGDRSLVEFLTAHRADVHWRGEDGSSLLQLEAGLAITEYLLTQGVEVNTSDKEGDTPLHNAAERGEEEHVTLYIVNGADVNAENRAGLTPMWVALFPYGSMVDSLPEGLESAFPNIVTIVNALAEGGADPNVKDPAGFTMLHRAILGMDESMVRVLLSLGADPNIPDPLGRSPLKIARVGKYEGMIALLLKHNGK